MEKVGKAISKYTDNTLLDLLNFFELTVFCFLTGNNDMHLKNSMIIQNDYTWNLTPAYNLLNVAIANPDDKEESALTMTAGKDKFNRQRFAEFGQNLGLSSRQIEGVFKRLLRNEKKRFNLIRTSFLSKAYQQKYSELLSGRYDRISP